jgi:tRNA(Glu) U13 pseudouridine synthase TruD
VRGLISDPGLREIPYFLNKRKEIISHAPDWNKVLEELNEFPLIFPSEIKVVNHLVSHPTDFAGALQRVEEQVVLWVSAVASLLYNRRISSYIMTGMEPPEFLPLFLSEDKNDWLPYQEDLEEVGIFPPNLNNLKHFRNISTQHKDIKTKDVAEIHSAEITDEGLAVSFTLGKGEYATTFLSHFITLLGGKVPEDITEVPIDVKKSLGEESSEETLKYFKDLNVSRK